MSFAPVLASLQLVAVTLALGYTSIQVRDAGRAAAMASVSMVKQNYVEHRIRFYSWFAESFAPQYTANQRLDREPQMSDRVSAEDMKSLSDLSLQVRVMGMLDNIEYASSLHSRGLLDDEDSEVVERYIQQDAFRLTFMLHYDGETGELCFETQGVAVPWVKQEDEQRVQYLYTAQLMREVGIRLVNTDPVTGEERPAKCEG